jgi:hypothetical protein
LKIAVYSNPVQSQKSFFKKHFQKHYWQNSFAQRKKKFDETIFKTWRKNNTQIYIIGGKIIIQYNTMMMTRTIMIAGKKYLCHALVFRNLHLIHAYIHTYSSWNKLSK